MDPHDEFNRQMHKLFLILGKILKLDKRQGGTDFSELFNNNKNINLNLCIFNFIPMTPEEVDEFEEMMEDFYHNREGLYRHSLDPDFKFELNARDMDFLKKHGIRF